MLSAILRRALCALSIIAAAAPRLASAQEAASGGAIGFIRDAEIEGAIRLWVSPVFTAAGLDASAVHIYLVNDPRINSFVAGGQNVFINTGIITRSQVPNQLIGVIAHETGHIAGGHLARSQEELRNDTIKGIIAMVLGAGAAAAAHGQGAGAVLQSGEGVALQSFLQYSIEQEARADHAALGFLDATHQSAQGLLDFFRKLEGEELLSAIRQDPYLRTHPLTTQRVDYVARWVAKSPFSSARDKPEFLEMLDRMVAKLHGFLDPPGQTLTKYKESDPSVAARYARAIGYYKLPNLAKAVPVIDGLIQQEPKNPYFRELKGQMLFEGGHGADALEPYEEAVRLAPDQPLLRIELAQVQIESGRRELNKSALANLKEAVRVEDRNSEAWHFLAVAYGREEDFGMAALAGAEEAMNDGDKPLALLQANKAIHILKPGTPARLRAEDLKDQAQRKS
ncbi:MAG: M48 family metalloprotease [Alphaproteobacteria bacterium]|nr:M48 family metalloprotease [Alphaproteobacteria bacterium]